MAVNKVYESFDAAVADVADGSMVHVGGFGTAAEYASYLIARQAAPARAGAFGPELESVLILTANSEAGGLHD